MGRPFHGKTGEGLIFTLKLSYISTKINLMGCTSCKKTRQQTTTKVKTTTSTPLKPGTTVQGSDGKKYTIKPS